MHIELTFRDWKTHLGVRGDKVVVHTEMQVSETDQRLIGFTSEGERAWFRLLTAVQGVGSKVALATLSALAIEELQRACANGDAAMVARANGVGPKLASRIVNELRDKVGALAGIGGGAKLAAAAKAGNNNVSDAVAALTGLGFKPGEAQGAVALALEELGDGATLDALVRLALKRAAK